MVSKCAGRQSLAAAPVLPLGMSETSGASADAEEAEEGAEEGASLK